LDYECHALQGALLGGGGEEDTTKAASAAALSPITLSNTQQEGECKGDVCLCVVLFLYIQRQHGGAPGRQCGSNENGVGRGGRWCGGSEDGVGRGGRAVVAVRTVRRGERQCHSSWGGGARKRAGICKPF
jgi:hypothetical protein